MQGKKLFLVIAFSGAAVIARSQTAEEVISKYISFIGGAHQWQQIQSITSTGTYNYGGLEFPFKSYSKAPDLYKYVVTAHGKSFSQAFDGNVGWRIDGFKNETRKTMLKDHAARAMANENDVELESPFINYQQKGHFVTLEGTDTAAGKTCFKINLVTKTGDTATCFFDHKSFALVKKQAVSKNTEMDNSLLDIFYSDYRTVQGIKIPFRTVCTTNGQSILVITVKDLKSNTPVSTGIFRP